MNLRVVLLTATRLKYFGIEGIRINFRLFLKLEEESQSIGIGMYLKRMDTVV